MAYRVASFGNNASKPTRPTDINTPGYFVDGTQVDFGWFNTQQEEIARAVEKSGITLDKTNDEQLYDAIKSGGGDSYLAVPLGCASGVYYGVGTATDIIVEQKGIYTRVARGSASSATVRLTWPVPLMIRGLKVKDLEFRLQPRTAFDGTSPTVTAKLIKIHTDGTTSDLGSLTVNSLSTGSWLFKTAGNMGVSTFTPILQEGLYFQVEVNIDSATVGEVWFQMLTLVMGL